MEGNVRDADLIVRRRLQQEGMKLLRRILAQLSIEPTSLPLTPPKFEYIENHIVHFLLACRPVVLRHDIPAISVLLDRQRVAGGHDERLAFVRDETGEVQAVVLVAALREEEEVEDETLGEPGEGVLR